MPLDYLQWRVYFVPDYRPNESLFVYQVHHSLADGIANILFFVDLTDEPKLEMYPSLMVRFSFVQNLVIHLLVPFYLVWLTVKLVVLMKAERNGYKNDEIKSKLVAHKNVEFVPDIDMNDVKKRAAELSSERNKITINDVLMTVISKTVNDYLKEHT